MTATLFDVNVLLAIAWPEHTAHERVTRWRAHRANEDWATCPFTQAAFVRILCNPAFSPNALTPGDAVALLTKNLGHPAHQFWADDIGIGEAMRPFENRIVGHQQITDAYLLGLAIHKRGKLATLDRSVLNLLPEGNPHRASVEAIGKS